MVVLIGELMKQAERYIAEGLHPRIIAEASGVSLCCCCCCIAKGLHPRIIASGVGWSSCPKRMVVAILAGLTKWPRSVGCRPSAYR